MDQQIPGIQGAVNLIPGSFTYAATARQTGNSNVQPPPLGTAVPRALGQQAAGPKPPASIPQITEVTVLRQGGHCDHQTEMHI